MVRKGCWMLSFAFLSMKPDRKILHLKKKKPVTWTVLLQEFKKWPTLFGEQLAKDLESWEAQSGRHLLQYVDNLLIATKTQEACLEWMEGAGISKRSNSSLRPAKEGPHVSSSPGTSRSSFLSTSMGEPVVHDCLETIKATYSSCLDLKDTLLENTETWSTNGSS
ncbi:hypothetical protein DUI87_04834 [Hirundo rustica rustica]|uniref:Reverse transcriptase domain-containing protein n=1 Tax=Hirundo rustica rustica TaxID=333673 RepID=A0A3M0L4Q2_HIRRU|nr:hypothetical protein DUI87_04834 [Hirundo rustica rustica]